jgi:hypothetical protein
LELPIPLLERVELQPAKPGRHAESRPVRVPTTKLLLWIAFGAAALVLSIPVIVAAHLISFVNDPLCGWGMFGTFVIYLAVTDPPRKEIGVTVLLGVALRLLYDVAIGEKGYQYSTVIAMGAFLGMASFIMLAVQAVRLTTERRVVVRRALGVVAMLNYIAGGLAFFFIVAKEALPSKLDRFLYAFDGSLGFEPSFALSRLVSAVPALHWLTAMAYNSFGLWFGVIYAVHARAHGTFRFKVVRLIVLNSLIGYLLYCVFPAAGPKYAFPTFPVPPGAVKTGAVVFSGIPNAMPSLHLAGTLLVFWMAKPWRWLRAVTGVICVLTAIATMSTGEHYFVDLVVALPFSLAVFALASDARQRWFPLLAGAGMLFLWLGLLRYGNVYPVMSWSLVALTVIFCFISQRKFAHNVWTAQVG